MVNIIRQWPSWSEPMSIWVGAIVSARADMREEALAQLIEHFATAEPGKTLEYIIRTIQSSERLSEKNIERLWDIYDEAKVPDASQQIALLTVGTMLRDHPDADLTKLYVDRMLEQLQLTPEPSFRKTEIVAALGNIGSSRASSKLAEIAEKASGDLALEAIDALRFDRSRQARDVLHSYVRQTRDLRRHDRSVLAMSFQVLGQKDVHQLIRAYDAIPESEGDRRQRIRQIINDDFEKRPSVEAVDFLGKTATPAARASDTDLAAP